MKKYILFLMFLLVQIDIFGQTIFYESLGTVAATTTIATHETNNGFDNDAYTMNSGGATNPSDIRATSFSTGYAGASGSANVWFTNTSGEYGFAINGIDASSCSGLQLSFAVRKEGGSGTAFATLALQYSTNNGSNWFNISYTPPATASAAGWYLLSGIALPADAQVSNLWLRWVKTGTIACRLDDITLSGTCSACTPPTINTHPSNSAISEGANTSFAVSATGTTLTYQWQVSTNSGGNWTDLTNTGVYTNVTTATMNITGALASMNGYWYRCRVIESGSCNTNSNHGILTVTCSTPTIVTGTSGVPSSGAATINWSNPGCFDEILVIANDASGCTFIPSGDGTAYTPNTVFSSIDQVVYKGTGTSVTVTGLTNGIPYYFEIFTRKGTSWTASCVEVTVTPSSAPCLVEDFTSATFAPTGWIQTSVSRSTTAADYVSAPAAAIFAANNGTLTTSSIANPNLLTFYLGRSSNTTAKTLNIRVSTTSQVTGFSTIATYDHANVPVSSYNQYTVDLSAYSGNSTVYIQFEKVSSTTSPWRLDDISVTCGVASFSEINVVGNSNNIVSGDMTPSATDDTDFGSVDFASGSINKTFTIQNIGAGILSISSVTITGTNASDFSILSAPSSTIAPSDNSNLQIRFDPSAIGLRTALVTIANNDSDENPYTFAIQGTGLDCITPTIVTGASATPFDASASINWTNSICFDEIMVVVTSTVGCTFSPSGDGSAYTANNVFAGFNQVVYKGTGTSVNITGLTNGTPYYFEIFTRKGTNWTSCVEVNTTPILTPCVQEGFNAGITPPSGWNFSGITTTYTSAGNFGTSSPSISLNDNGDYVETATLSSSASALSFWIKGLSTNATSTFRVEGWNGSTWVLIDDINPIPTTATTKTYNISSSPILPAGILKFRFTYNKSAGNLAFDDVTIYCGSITCSAPTTQAINIVATPSDVLANLSWTNGSGSKRIVIMNTSNSFVDPNNSVDPSANSVYSGAGQQVIYNGTASLVTVTGLTPNTTYYVRVYEANCSGTNIYFNVNTNANNPISFTTTLTPTTTILKPGDLAFIAYDAQIDCGGSNDMFYITNLIDLSPGTKFKVVNSRFEAGAPANVRTNYWRGASNDPFQDPGVMEFTLTGASVLPAGSIISFKANGTTGAATNILINGAPTVNLVNSYVLGVCNISSGDPDQIFIVQGDFTSYGIIGVDRYNLLNGRVLYGLTNGVDWVPFTTAVSSANAAGTARQSRIPDDIECFNLAFPTRREVTFYNNSALHEGSKKDILLSLMTAANYTNPAASSCLNVVEDFTSPYTPTAVGKPFVITTGFLDGYWNGEQDVNWFNCRNWEGLFVPDSTIDVVIPDVSSNRECKVDINNFAISATKYGNIAKAKSITITGERLVVENTGALKNNLIIFNDLVLNGPSVLDMNDGDFTTTDGQINIKGNWINLVTESDFSEGNGTVVFDSTFNQTITTADVNNVENFYNLTIQKSSGLLTLNDSITIDINDEGGKLNFMQGKINANTFKVKINNTASNGIINHGALKYIYGGDVQRKVIPNISYDFPVGTFNFYELATISLSADADINGTNDYISANFVNPHNGTTPSGLIEGANDFSTLLDYGYWDIHSTGVLNAGTYDITLNERGYTNGGSGLYTTIKRDDGASVWVLPGTAGSSSEIGGVVTASRTGINSFSHHAIAIPSPLALDLLYFKAKKLNKNTAELTWKTANEQEIAYFDIEKSVDGKSFKKIASQKSKPNNYTEYDNNPAEGINYYRLKIVETIGKYSYSEIRSVMFGEEFSVLIYPNPATDILNILATSEIENIKIFDVLSREIITINNHSIENSIDISPLSKGTYFIKVESKNSETKTIKFVK